MKQNEQKKIFYPPIRILQFGEGNFLRAFIGDLFQQLNDDESFSSSIAVVQPIETGSIEVLASQKGRYTIFLEGLINGKELHQKREVKCVKQFVNPYSHYADFIALAKLESLQIFISNTTEKGISFNLNDDFSDKPASSYAGKLVQFLFTRYTYFNGCENKGLHILPCELIDNNGQELLNSVQSCIKHWKLENSFITWVENHCFFYQTLVDRIVTGYPKSNSERYLKKAEFEDKLITVAEPYFLWAIKGAGNLSKILPTDKVHFTSDLEEFKLRKVRILNGLHTTLVAIGLSLNKETIGECMEDPFLAHFAKNMLKQEVAMTLKHRFNDLKNKSKSHPLNPKIVDRYIKQVLDRLNNPFVHHKLHDIGFYSLEKFKVRVLSTILDYHRKMGLYPLHMIYGFACLLLLYTRGGLGVNDDPELVVFLKKQKSVPTFKMVQTILSHHALWGSDLTKQPLLSEILYYAVEEILKHGVRRGFYFFYQNQVS